MRRWSTRRGCRLRYNNKTNLGLDELLKVPSISAYVCFTAHATSALATAVHYSYSIHELQIALPSLCPFASSSFSRPFQLFAQRQSRAHAVSLSLRTWQKSALVNGSKVDMVLKALRLERAANTIVGNGVIRGVSGGEKRRLTIGEMMVRTSAWSAARALRVCVVGVSSVLVRALCLALLCVQDFVRVWSVCVCTFVCQGVCLFVLLLHSFTLQRS